MLPWQPRSGRIVAMTRNAINTFFPSLRRTSFQTWHDGPLHSKIPSKTILHNMVIEDNYKYLEEPHHRETLKVNKREMWHTAAFSAKLDTGHGKFRVWGEMDARIVVSTREGGFDKGEERIGDYLYFTRTTKQDSTDIAYYRKKVGDTDLLAEELINPIVLQQQFGYRHCAIGICRVSENGKMIAYTLSVEGGDRFICHVKTIDNASIFHVIRSSNIVSIEFGGSNNFFYTECNELNRPYRVMMQELRPGLLPDPIEIYRDEDEEFFVDVRKTKDGKYITISSDSKTKGNVLVIPSTFPIIPKALKPLFAEGKPVEIANKEAWGWLEHHGGCFIMVTSANAPNFKIVYVREEVALREQMNAQWTELVPHDEKTQITDVDIFKTHLILFETTFGFEKSSQMRVINLEDGIEKSLDRNKDIVIHFPPLSYLTPGLNKNFSQDTINFTYSNIVTPSRECVYQLKNQLDADEVKWTHPHHLFTVRQHETFTPWDYLWPYHIYRDVATAEDGTDIPITICQKRDLFVDEITDADPLANTPRYCFLYVYGSYGEVPAMHFQLAPYVWLMRRRWTIAFAHVRGGGELPGWAEAGKGKNKMNTVTDFVRCCEHLIETGVTTTKHLIVGGNSAGCVPIAAAANMRGNTLFKYALMRAPFLDILNTMCDPTLPLSLAERGDWGDPLNSEEDMKRLLKYDPYYNINDNVRYPAMLISSALDDDRVPAWNAIKYVAKLREQRSRDQECDPAAAPLVLRLIPTGGHYYWSQNLPLAEEIAILCHMLHIPGPFAKNDDLDAMQQMHNYFETGLMDHDDQNQTFLKWDAWEYERIDFVTKMHRMNHEPNFRVLAAKKDPFYWDKVEPDEPIPPPMHTKADSEVNHASIDVGPDPFQMKSKKANVTIGDRKTK